MPKSFNIKAGKTALAHIKENGLSPEDISVIPAAAGGPKWIVLHAFDKYLLRHWFHNRTTPIDLVGASAGAWRMMCYAVNKPIETLDRFLESYVEQSYPVWPTGQEVSQKMKEILEYSLGENGNNELLDPVNKFLHVITSQSSFAYKAGSAYKPQFAKIVLKNLLSRNRLSGELDRVVFSNNDRAKNLFNILDKIKTEYNTFSKDNLIEALRATGTIPMLMEPVTTITNPPQMLWDGALVDYHIGLQYSSSGLVFYPHFSNRIIPGWFDKFTPWRKVDKRATDNMIMVYPSAEFVASLPDQKIPDRKDFEIYFEQKSKRISNWYEVAKRGEEIALEFHKMYTNGSLVEAINLF